MKISDLQNLDPQRIGSWPLPVRALIFLGLCIALLASGFYLDTRNQMTSLAKTQAEEDQLWDAFELKQGRAANLGPLKQLLAEMKQSLGEQLRLLPNKTEIEGLLVDISQSGLASGLEFELFKPETEQPAEFYAIQPIRITVTGTYHEFGNFISAVAALPRIVTQHDVNIAPRKGDTGDTLVMSMVAKTYRYMDDDEIAARAVTAEEKSGKKGRKKKKKKK
ncbi:MAG: pilus assembly protein PilO [Thiotrichales bacterium]|nr:pilus assembly protein PilO [Thiotrichales bacterium]